MFDETKTYSFIFSIEGQWGSGKTSVMASLQNRLLKRTLDENKYFVLKIQFIIDLI